MLDTTVIRLRDGQLFWYPPGADQAEQRIDPDEIPAQLQQRPGAPRERLCFAAPGTDVTLLQVDFTQAEKKHITKSLPFMLEEQLVTDIEELHFATALADNNHLCAAICSEQQMQKWAEQLAPLSGVNRWTPEPQLLPWHQGEWTVLIEDRHAIVRTGDCEGFSIEREFLREMLDAAWRDAREAPQAVIVYGQDQTAETGQVPEVMRELVQWRRGDLRAAMLLNTEDSIAVNLLQGSFAHRLPLRRWWQQWRMVAAVFAVAFCLQLISDYASYLSLERENLDLRRETETSARKVIPRGALNRPEVQITRKLDALRGTAQSSGFVSLMNRVGTILAAKSSTGIASINYNDRNGEMRMNITAPDFEAVEAIRIAMTKSGLAAVMESSSVQGDLVRARLRVGEGT